jgi:lactoylglutathione lyase
MSSRNLIPVVDLFEAHLAVTNLDRAVAFYRDELGLPLARVFPERRVAFFWIGSSGNAMLGLWEAGTMPIRVSLHTAFRVILTDLLEAPAKLRAKGIQPLDLDGRPADEPIVLAWMPAAAIYFQDPDNNLLEFITMLPDAPRSELGVLSWSDWMRRKSLDQSPVSVEVFRDRRTELLPLFELADDSRSEISSYIELGEVLVARRETLTIGHIQVISKAGESEIKSLAVTKNEQGRGVGSALVRAALVQAFSAGALRVRIATASADIDNLRFYQRLGFRMDSVEHDAFTVDRGYRSTEGDGIPVRDRVWLSIRPNEVRQCEIRAPIQLFPGPAAF